MPVSRSETRYIGPIMAQTRRLKFQARCRICSRVSLVLCVDASSTSSRSVVTAHATCTARNARGNAPAPSRIGLHTSSGAARRSGRTWNRSAARGRPCLGTSQTGSSGNLLNERECRRRRRHVLFVWAVRIQHRIIDESKGWHWRIASPDLDDAPPESPCRLGSRTRSRPRCVCLSAPSSAASSWVSGKVTRASGRHHARDPVPNPRYGPSWSRTANLDP